MSGPNIVDRRNTKSTKNDSNRKRFIDRFKKTARRVVDEAIKKRSIKDADKPIDAVIHGGVTEPVVDYDKDTGDYEIVSSGNDRYKKGDKIRKEKSSSGKGKTSVEDGEDDFYFTLSKEDFYELFFEDLDLPDMVKEAMIDNTKLLLKRAGYIKDGVPNRLDIKKTMEMAVGRRLACKNSKKKPPFIDDVDLRFRHFKKVPQPMTKAVMFCLMDVSGSMEEHHKMLSKKFFIFLYLFLTKNYKKVDVRFIRYHHDAQETDEQEFFYGRTTGGTWVSKAVELVSDIIDSDYSLEETNVYVAHTSDGDYFDWDIKNDRLITALRDSVLPKVQYYAYLQVQNIDDYEMFYHHDFEKLYGVLKKMSECGGKLNIETALEAEDIYPVLRNLFKKR